MKLILIIISFLLFTSCSYTNIKYASNEIETSSVVRVKPKVINESAFENFYMSEKLEWIKGDYFHFKKESSRKLVADEITKFLLPIIQNCR